MTEFVDMSGFDETVLDETGEPYPSSDPYIDPYTSDEVMSDPAVWEAPTPTGDADDLPNFDPVSHVPVAGEPASDMDLWHMQEQMDTCAVASQEFVLEGLTGVDFDEAALAQEAIDNGWYQPGGGTSMANLDSLLEAHGVATETHFDGTVTEIEQALAEGNKVIVPLDSGEIWEQGEDPYLDDIVGDPMPGQGADHAVEVIGVVDTPEGRMVVLNDPGHPDGRGEMIPVAEFENAWADSDSFWVNAGPTANDSIDALPGSLATATLGTSTSGDVTADSFAEDYKYLHSTGDYRGETSGREIDPWTDTEKK